MTHKDLHDAILRKIQNSRTDDQGRGRKIKTVLSQAANRKGGFKEEEELLCVTRLPPQPFTRFIMIP